MMFLPMFLMMIAGLGLIYLWEEVRRDEATRRYHEEVEAIMASRERKVVYTSPGRKRNYDYHGDRRHRRCC